MAERFNSKTSTFKAFGEEMTYKEWSGYSGIPGSIIRQRIKAGWTPEKALTTPVKTQHQSKCWTCQRAYGDCNWSAYCIGLSDNPVVEGWDAVKKFKPKIDSNIRPDGGLVYHVNYCPKYISDIE